MEKKKRHLKPGMKEKLLRAKALREAEKQKEREEREKYYKEHPEKIQPRIVAW